MRTICAPRSQRASFSDAASLAMPRSARSSLPARTMPDEPGEMFFAAKEMKSDVLVQSTNENSRFSARSSVWNSSHMRAALVEQPASFRSAA